jgi:hypothetical protein
MTEKKKLQLPVDPRFPGLQFKRKLSYEEWIEAGKRVSQYIVMSKKYLAFMVGDWINYGADHFPNKYEAALEAGMYEIGSLRNICYICRKVKPHQRRMELSFNHHAVVAPFAPEKQAELLQKCTDESLSVHSFRRMSEGDPHYRTNMLPSNIMGDTKKSWDKFWESRKEELAKITLEEACRTAFTAGWKGRSERDCGKMEER